LCQKVVSSKELLAGHSVFCRDKHSKIKEAPKKLTKYRPKGFVPDTIPKSDSACKLCKKLFGSKELLAGHVVFCQDKHSESGQKGSASIPVVDLEAEQTATIYTCGLCQKVLSSKELLTGHLIFCREKHSKKTKSSATVSIPVESHQTDPTIVCELCQKVLGSKELLAAHLVFCSSKNTKKKEAAKEKKPKPVDSSAKNTIAVQLGSIHACELCQKVLPSKELLAGHLIFCQEKNCKKVPKEKETQSKSTVPVKNRESDQIHECEVCHKILNSKKLLTGHLRIMHSKKKEVDASSPVENLETNACELCKKVLGSRELLAGHLVFCRDKHSSTLESSPVELIDLTQTTATVHACDLCHKTFTSKELLAGHQVFCRVKRPKAKPKPKKRTFSNNKLDWRKLEFVCEGCDKKLKKSDVEEHVVSCFGDRIKTDKTFEKVLLSNFGFFTQSAKISSSEFKCFYCPERFASGCEAYRHAIGFHDMQVFSIAFKKLLVQHKMSQRLKIECPHCVDVFSVDDLLVHLAPQPSTCGCHFSCASWVEAHQLHGCPA